MTSSGYGLSAAGAISRGKESQVSLMSRFFYVLEFI